jgi:hypothetical protein
MSLHLFILSTQLDHTSRFSPHVSPHSIFHRYIIGVYDQKENMHAEVTYTYTRVW